MIESPINGNAATRRVLVADDHPDTLLLSKIMLEDVGHDVLTRVRWQ